MAEITTTKQVNASQLCVELGRIAVRVRHADPVRIWADTDEASLMAAVEAHEADPNWSDPNPPPPTETERANVELAKLRSKCQAVFAGSDSFSASQAQKLIAALVLREIASR